MNTTPVYNYRMLRKPAEVDINELGAAGYHVHSFQLDPRDGELMYVLMEQTTSAALIDEQSPHERVTEFPDVAFLPTIGNRKRGR